MPFRLQCLLSTLLLAFVSYEVSAQTVLREEGGRQWFKGNTHTHTLWSDGDAAPEVSVAWYKEHGYDFLCLSDHNVLSDGSVEMWKPIKPDSRLTEERVGEIAAKFGEGWVVQEVRGATPHMKLKTLPQIRERFEEPGKFILIQAEEVTSKFPAVHVGALNLRRVIPPVNQRSQVRVLTAALNNLAEQEALYGVPMMAHLNHPNFASGVTIETMIEVEGLRFFEVYNGHPQVFNWGQPEKHRPSTDRMWDITLAQRLRHGGGSILYGLATDDTHNYFKLAIGESNAGRGWVHVLAEKLETNDLIDAMERGDFYSSTGVEIREIASDGKEFRVDVATEPEVTYTTQFIGTRKGFDPSSEPVLDETGKQSPETNRTYSPQIGVVLHETTDNPAVYAWQGDELYVRAKVVSSKVQENPFAEGDVESAWTQPVIRDQQPTP